MKQNDVKLTTLDRALLLEIPHGTYRRKRLCSRQVMHIFTVFKFYLIIYSHSETNVKLKGAFFKTQLTDWKLNEKDKNNFYC